jgi:hypothetical protein
VSGQQLTPEAELIAKFFAKKAKASAQKAAKERKRGGSQVDEVELAERLQEIELETQILGASFLKVHIIDPELTLVNSGWLELDEGLFQPVTVEFPEGSKYMWSLCAVECTTNVGANLECTFESSLVAKLREKWEPRQAPPGTRTRAQFVRDLLQESGVPYVIPGINKLQPVEEEEKNEVGTTIAKAGIERAKAQEKVNKTKGIGHGTNVKIDGAAPSKQQLADINTALKTASKLKAPPLAIEALIAAGISESGFRREVTEGGKSQTSPQSVPEGIWQSDKIPGDEVARQAEHFLIGGESFSEGGAIKRAKETPAKTPGQIAYEVEVGGDVARTEEVLPQAKAIIQEWGGVDLGGTSTNAAESDVSQLTRGTPGNPDEDSFEAITRLASQVDWFAFTYQVPGHPETMFYIDGPELARQKITAYIDVQENYLINVETGVKEYGVVLQPATFTFDQTTFEYRQDHKVKQKVQKKSKIAKPSTPSEVRLEIVCGIEDYRAGDVFVIRGFGPANGRWIVTDATRNCLKDTFTKFILEPPVEPLPEPIATAKGAELTGEGITSVAAVAKKALAEQQASKLFKYVYGAGHQAGSKLFGQAPREMDCSAFASLCYQEAGTAVPGQSGSTLPGSQEMIEAMKKTSTPEPGDLCFFGTESHTTHVTVYVGGGNAISMGQEGDPEEGPYKTTGPSGFLGVWAP